MNTNELMAAVGRLMAAAEELGDVVTETISAPMTRDELLAALARQIQADVAGNVELADADEPYRAAGDRLVDEACGLID